MAATSDDFRAALDEVFTEAERLGLSFIGLTSKALHERVGGYSGTTNHRMPVCCRVMRSVMGAGDTIIAEPPSGDGATLLIHYSLPRTRTLA